jgi:hypothetical protein
VTGLHDRLRAGEDEFVYACFVMSPFLDGAVRPERTGFDIPDVTDDALDQGDPSIEDIRETTLVAVEQYLIRSWRRCGMPDGHVWRTTWLRRRPGTVRSSAFHDYLASDKPIRSMPIAESLSPLEPDLLAL